MFKSSFKLRNGFIKKSIAVISSLAIILSVILTVPFVTKAQNTEKMFVISPNAAGQTKYANVFVPLNFLEVDGQRLHSQESDIYYYFKLSFKAKLNNDKMPIVGVVRYAYWFPGAQSEYNYVNNNQETHSDTLLTSSYDPVTMTYTAIIRLWINPDPSTGVHTALTIGNMEHNNNWHKENNFDASFAFTAPELYAYNTETGATFGGNLLPQINDSTFTGQTYKHPQNGYNSSDGLLKAPANKWSIDTTSSLISIQDIPEGYFEPENHEFIKVEKKIPTETEEGYKEHYICECGKCDGKYYLSAEKASLVTYDQIVLSKLTPIGDQKMFVISPNAAGQSKYANVFVPLDFLEVDGKRLHSQESDKYYYFKLTFRAKLNNDKMPIVGVVRYAYWYPGAQSEFSYINNNQESHDDTLLTSSYDPDTTTYTAIIKLWINPDPSTGVHTALTIGNMEHNNTWHKENNFDASFAFTAPELYAYNTETGTTFGENLLPQVTDSTFTGETYKHPQNGYNSSDGLLKAPANKWSIDTTDSLISLQDVPTGYFDHKLEKVPAKAPTKDEVGYKQHYICYCKYCQGKLYSDKSGLNEVTLEDLKIEQIGDEKIIVVSPNVAGGSTISNLFIPLTFRKSGDTQLNDGNYYFKLSFKARVYGNSLPIVGIARYASWSQGAQSEFNNANNNQDSHSDTIISSSYDPSTYTFTAIVKLDISDARCHPETGVHSFITIGNAEHNNTWYKEHNFDASFAFTSPELYLYNASTGETSGENLINPITESTVSFDKAYKFTANEYDGDDGFMAAPANMWCIDGPESFINMYDYKEDYFTAGVHEYVEHAYKEATETEKGNEMYYSCNCDDCKDKYFINYGLTEVEEEQVITTAKMITIEPNTSSNKNIYNVFIPLDFRTVNGTTLNDGTYYFKLQFKAKLLGEGLPIVGIARYANWNGGTQSEFNYANNNIDTHEDQVLYSEYDPETCMFTAVVKMLVGDTYCHPETGVHSFITIGNAEHNDAWHKETNFRTRFSFTSPSLYLYDSATGTTSGENLLKQLNQNNIDTSRTYKYTKNGYTGNDGFIKAPANIWSVDGNNSKVSVSDIPSNYFVTVKGNSNLVMFAGKINDDFTNGQGKIFQKVALESGKKYQLSYNAKYAGTGVEGDSLGGQLEYDSTDGIKELTSVKTESATEYKEIFTFTMPADAKDSKNFKFIFNYSSAYTSGFMANFELYELDGDNKVTGENLFQNGDFSIGGTAMWIRQGENKTFTLAEIPENFFSKVNPAKPNMAIYRNTSDYAQIMQMPMLKPNTTYEFKYKDLHTDYASDKKPYTIFYQFYYNDSGKVENSSVPDDEITQTTDGVYTTKVFTTTDRIRVHGNDNSIFRLYMRSGSAGFWGPVELYELDANGNRVGNNILLNGDFTLGTLGWDLTGESTVRTVEMPDGFFENYKAPEKMVYSEGKAADQTYMEEVKVAADKAYYYHGSYVNMNAVGVNPQIQYLTKDNTYKDYAVEPFYDADRYYFEIKFEAPEDAKVTNGMVDLRVQMNNLKNGKGYFTELMFTEDGKYINLLKDFDYGSNYKVMSYDSNVFVSYFDDKNFDDGDWSGELAANAYEIKIGAISGRVVDKDGKAMDSIKMKLVPGDIESETDMFGTYNFDNLEPGEYKLYLVENDKSSLFCLDVTVKKGILSNLPSIIYDNGVEIAEDEEIYEEEIDGSENDNISGDQDLEFDIDDNDGDAEYGILRGFYYDKKGKTIAGATIYLRGYGSVTTDDSGMFMFENIEPGEYELYVVSEDGKEYVLRTVTITANKGIQVKVMEPIDAGSSSLSLVWIIVICVAGGVVLCGAAAVVVLSILVNAKKKRAAQQ